MPRFTVEPATSHPGTDAYKIVDHEADQWRLPHDAVSLRLRHSAAEQVARLLNQEWASFVRNPT